MPDTTPDTPPQPPRRPMSRWYSVAVSGLALVVAVITCAFVVRGQRHEQVTPANCINNGRLVPNNTGPCIYNPRTDTCPPDVMGYYTAACIDVHAFGEQPRPRPTVTVTVNPYPPCAGSPYDYDAGLAAERAGGCIWHP